MGVELKTFTAWVWMMSLHGGTGVLIDKVMMSKDEVSALVGCCGV